MTAVSRTSADWEAIERDYRAGVKTLRQIAEEQGISHGAINKRAKKEGWERDLSAKIQAKADALVSKATVSKEVSKEQLATERDVVESNAQVIADSVLGQRKDVRRARGVVTRLFDELEGQMDNIPELESLADFLASDESVSDRRIQTFNAVISLAGRTDTAKKLADALKVLVELERKVLRIKDDSPSIEEIMNKSAETAAMSAADAYAMMCRGGS